MKTEEDEAFDDLARRQRMWGGGFQAKRAAAADKLHWSDCAVHNGPAYPAGKCDCGVAQEPEREALKLALEALTLFKSLSLSMKEIEIAEEAIASIEAALAQPAQDGKCKLCVDGCAACDARAQPAQEPVQRGPIPKAQSLNELMNRMNQSLQKADMEADMLTIAYQSGYHDGKKAALAGREWNFCERCGKRTKDLTTIHTCTPPQEKNG
jgi:hypothetical protein